MAERGGRSYRDLAGRTTRKPRDAEQERLPGDQSSPGKLQDAFDVDDQAVVVEVDVDDPVLERQLEESEPTASDYMGDDAPGPDTSHEQEPNEGRPHYEGAAEQDQEKEGTTTMATPHVPKEADVKEYFSEEELAKDFPDLVAASKDEDDKDDDKDEKKDDDKDDREKEGCGGKDAGGMPWEKDASAKEDVQMKTDNIPEINIAEVEILDDGATAQPKEASFAEQLRMAMEGEDDGTMPPLPEMPQLDAAPEQPEMSLPEGTEPPSMDPCDCPGSDLPEMPESPDAAGEGAPAPVQSEDEGVLPVDEGGSAKASPEYAEGDDAADVAAEEEDSGGDSSPTEASAAGETVYETLGNISALAEVSVDRVDLVLANEDSENPHYIVTVDGDPVAKVALADQPANLVRDHSDLFTDDGYPQYVLEGVANFGLGETLKNVHARYYTAAATSGEVAEQMRTAAVSDMQEDHRQRLAETKDRLINAANIVLQGSLKNYILANPLKDALVRNMRAAGVDEAAAVDAVEHAWTEAAPVFFEATLRKAEEWLGAPPEVLEHHIKEISAMDYRHPGVAPSQEIEVAASAPRAPMPQVPANVPVRTSTQTPYQPQQRQAAAPTGQWDKDQWKKRINLHGRVASASMAKYGPGGNRR